MDRELDQLEKQARAEVLRPHLMKHLVRNALYRWLVHGELTRAQAEMELENADQMLANMGYTDMVRMHRFLLGLNDSEETAV